MPLMDGLRSAEMCEREWVMTANYLFTEEKAIWKRRKSTEGPEKGKHDTVLIAEYNAYRELDAS